MQSLQIWRGIPVVFSLAISTSTWKMFTFLLIRIRNEESDSVFPVFTTLAASFWSRKCMSLMCVSYLLLSRYEDCCRKLKMFLEEFDTCSAWYCGENDESSALKSNAACRILTDACTTGAGFVEVKLDEKSGPWHTICSWSPVKRGKLEFGTFDHNLLFSTFDAVFSK